MKNLTCFTVGTRGMMLSLGVIAGSVAYAVDTPSTTPSAPADHVVWFTDFTAAQALAHKEHKLLLLDFTGSDWCGWCMRLEAEVFSTREFSAWASSHAVVMTVDFPQALSQSEGVKRQNAELAEHYGITGFPTMVILDHNGVQLGEVGYSAGGPTVWLEKLDRTIKRPVQP